MKVWWDGFRKWLDDQTDPHEAARRLRRKLRGLELWEERRFFEQAVEILLQDRHAYGVALFLLEGVSDPTYLVQIAERLQPLPELQSDDEESHLADLIRILAAANDPRLIPVVEQYLIEREMGVHWSTVPWAVWPHHQQLFGRAWKRFFLEHEPSEWKNTLVIRSFLTEPEAIRVVREQLARKSDERWTTLREALIRQAGLAAWLSEEQRAALDRAVA
jgi:hypothetical protein